MKKTKAKQRMVKRKVVSRGSKKVPPHPVAIIPGEIILGEGDITAFPGRRTVELTVAKTVGKLVSRSGRQSCGRPLGFLLSSMSRSMSFKASN